MYIPGRILHVQRNLTKISCPNFNDIKIPYFTLTLKLDRTFSSRIYLFGFAPQKGIGRDGESLHLLDICAFILRHLFSLIQVGRSGPQCSAEIKMCLDAEASKRGRSFRPLLFTCGTFCAVLMQPQLLFACRCYLLPPFT